MIFLFSWLLVAKPALEPTPAGPEETATAVDRSVAANGLAAALGAAVAFSRSVATGELAALALEAAAFSDSVAAGGLASAPFL